MSGRAVIVWKGCSRQVFSGPDQVFLINFKSVFKGLCCDKMLNGSHCMEWLKYHAGQLFWSKELWANCTLYALCVRLILSAGAQCQTNVNQTTTGHEQSESKSEHNQESVVPYLTCFFNRCIVSIVQIFFLNLYNLKDVKKKPCVALI